MIIDDYEIWRIAIGDSLSHIKDDWESYGYCVNHFEAVTPSSMPNFIQFGQKVRQKRVRDVAGIVEFSDTEKAVFYSHYMLWKKCAESMTPFVIIEHDAKLIKPLPEVWDVDQLFYFTLSATPDKLKQKIVHTPAAGYILTPKCALALSKMVTDRLIRANVDHYVFVVSDQREFQVFNPCAQQIHHETKIEHV